jgi:thiol-disulfide isomerase/thioredoxin
MGNKPSTPGDVKLNETKDVNVDAVNVDTEKVDAVKVDAVKVDEVRPASSVVNSNAPPPDKPWWKLWGGSHKVVVVKLWAKWCGHCQAFEPEWKKLVQYFSKNPNIIFEHLEEKGMEKGGMIKLKHKYGNRISDPEGFPTLYLFRSSDIKKQTPYHGPRDFEGMKKEIEKLLMHKGSHNHTVKNGGAKKGKRKTMHRKRH